MSDKPQPPAPVEICHSQNGGTFTDAAQVLKNFLEWITKCKAGDPQAINEIGKRAIAAAWVVIPSRVENKSAELVAKQYEFEVTKFVWLTFDFSRHFKIKNALQGNKGRPPVQNSKGVPCHANDIK